jgi:hypothetical protein
LPLHLQISFVRAQRKKCCHFIFRFLTNLGATLCVSVRGPCPCLPYNRAWVADALLSNAVEGAFPYLKSNVCESLGL